MRVGADRTPPAAFMLKSYGRAIFAPGSHRATVRWPSASFVVGLLFLTDRRSWKEQDGYRMGDPRLGGDEMPTAFIYGSPEKGHVVASNPEKRTCSAPDCSTRLSIYNPSAQFCWLHETPTPKRGVSPTQP